MIQKVAFTLYRVRDAARARAFYEDTLGLTRGSASESGTWTEYDLPGGGCLALICMEGQGEPSATAGGTVAFEVEDLDATIAELEAKGVRFLQRMIPSPVCRMSIIADSEGNGIILRQLHKRA
ncbi:MAG: VOC family protein [Alphaproteobacteria bacterium]|nr:VOC family protein [Alphaproteobacteria bacterium]MCB9796803.1 VOC family protein [Alphaproteobacteria bacterium]